MMEKMFIKKEDLNLTIKTILNSNFAEVEEDKFMETNSLCLNYIEDVDMDTSFTNGTPFIYNDDNLYVLDFGGDETPKSIDLEENMTLNEVIELTKKELIKYQLEYINSFFEGIKWEKNAYGYDEDEWKEGVDIEINNCSNESFYINELLGDNLPQVLEEKIQEYLEKLNIDDISFDGRYIEINK